MRRLLHARRPIAWPRAQGGRIGWFVVVGCVAAFVHWSVVVALVTGLAWPPLVANVAGWLVAFSVSFLGHHRWTFRDHGVSIEVSARRFFVVSAGGFVVNESAYAVLLRWSGQRYDVILAAVLVAVAFATYWLRRRWAFLNASQVQHRRGTASTDSGNLASTSNP